MCILRVGSDNIKFVSFSVRDPVKTYQFHYFNDFCLPSLDLALGTFKKGILDKKGSILKGSENLWLHV